jgi:hypothetical protein
MQANSTSTNNACAKERAHHTGQRRLFALLLLAFESNLFPDVNHASTLIETALRNITRRLLSLSL